MFDTVHSVWILLPLKETKRMTEGIFLNSEKVLHQEEHAFSDTFVAYLLTRTVRHREYLVGATV
jgi:hypothetical protein